MGTKRWQLEKKDRELSVRIEQLNIALGCLTELLEFFERLDKEKLIKRAMTKINELSDNYHRENE